MRAELLRSLAEGPSGPLRALTSIPSVRAALDERDERGMSALARALLARRCDNVLLLLERCADPDQRVWTERGLLSLVQIAALDEGYASMTALAHLVDFGARVEPEDEEEEHPLALVHSKRREPPEGELKTRALLRGGASANARGPDDLPVLTLAARLGDRNSARLLLGAGADVGESAEELLAAGMSDLSESLRAFEERGLLSLAAREAKAGRGRRRI